MNYKKIVTTLFSILFCFSLFAQGPPGGGQGGGRGQGQGQQKGGKPDASEILSMLDTNDDNLIDKDEASKDKKGKISEDFDEIDSNEDGFIDLKELKDSLNNRKPTRRRVSPEKLLKEVDDNEDGTLNELEVAAKEKRELSDNFSEIDANQDGELDIDELKAFYASLEDEKPEKRRKKRE